MKAWENLLSSLEQELGSETVAQWLRPIRIVRFDAANLFLEATPFQIAWFDEQIRPRLKHFLNNNQRPIKIHWESAAVLRTPLPVSFEEPLLEKEGFLSPLEDAGRPKAACLNPSIKGQDCGKRCVQIVPAPLEKEFSLDSFVDSASNAMAVRIAREIASGEPFSFNPAFFSGPSSSGKTHLLMGIAQTLQLKGKKVFFVNAETFTNHVVQAIRLGQMGEFRAAYRDIDTFIVDDVHLLARRAATQEEFFHTFNALHTLGRPIILSAHENAKLLEDIEPRLISRFEWGISLNLNSPDPLMLRQILEQKAKLLEIAAPPDLIDFLLEHFSSPKAAIEALHAVALRTPQYLDRRHVEPILADLLAKEKKSEINTEEIIKQTSAFFGIRVEDLTGKSQMREFAQPRQIAIFLCRHLLKMPYQAIGRLFSRDHSTIISSVKQIESAANDNQSPLNAPIKSILKRIRTSSSKK